MKKLLLLLFILPATLTALADQVDRTAELLKTGNFTELGKLFAGSVDVTLMDDENMLSGTKALASVESFFKKNPIKTVKVLHRIDSNPKIKFGVILVGCSTGNYRVSVSFKQSGAQFLLDEFRVETEKA
ncbi:uncharacterized protein DUF4783 [Mucilaginibacter yixingensis]|uniref:Uncharacterized protein DUF4783 n=1 Tax=Mucilaginibacter yixingensis TaxID=1295612 RepID=A0A2T5JEY3_9SPHI|nr:DUF4783 domain-containing protein [Mucilaginibacter yixingensis]PTR00997.1 uncharacterized protein DUF4783 [Mucilaginibacter yixingensis]